MPADPQRLAAIVRQHAQTSRLLGVDFVPAYRTPGATIELNGPVEVEPLIERQSERLPQPALAPTRSHAIAEPKPVAKPAPTPPAALLDLPEGGYSGSGVLRLPDWKLPARSAGEDDRAFKLRAMAALRARYEADAPHQHFVTDHHCIVWSDGDVASRVVFVGEAPGEEEDKTGVPFVGRAGQLLSKMIAAMGLSRKGDAGDTGVYICNVLKTRPPNNATPTSREAGLCEPYLMEQLAIMRPLAIVTLGLPATRTLLKTDEAMGRLRGRWHELTIPAGSGGDALNIPVMPTYHPAFLLRSYTEDNRRKVWQDLQLVIQRLKQA
jgi:uracil-DNA glycosylase family 4